MRLVYVRSKTHNLGENPQLISNMTAVEDCPVTWVLLYYQAIGAIDDALEVWDGIEEFHIDPNKFLTFQDLMSYYERANPQLNEEQLAQLATDNPKIVGDLIGEIAKLHTEVGDNKIPFCVAMTNKGHPMTQFMLHPQYNKFLGQHAARYGFVVTKSSTYG